MTNDEDNYDDKSDNGNEHEDDVKCVDDEDDEEDMGEEDNDVNVFIIKVLKAEGHSGATPCPGPKWLPGALRRLGAPKLSLSQSTF